LLFHGSQHQPLDAVAEIGDVEVQEEPSPQSRQAQVGEKLGLMNWQQLLDSLDLDDGGLVDNEVEAVGAVDLQASILDRQRSLRHHHVSGQPQFMGKTDFVRGFQQARAERLVNLDRSADD